MQGFNSSRPLVSRGTLLDGRTALVTGAGRGIGTAIAHALAAEGAAVAVVARSGNEIEQVTHDLRARGANAISAVADVTRESDVVASIEATTRELGPIDILVNNAGRAVRGAIGEMSVEEWRQLVDINLIGPYLYCRGTIPGMVDRRWGRVINIGSVMSKVGMALFSAYTASKHGLIGLTRALAIEVADKGVTVNAVCPGVTKTVLNDALFEAHSRALGVTEEKLRTDAINKIPMKTAALPDQIAPAVVFLASEAAARITGEALNVSGGAVMH
jgi:NAD(P)-dependent dehydrogenase (short-subunit alcohol dehydrogenase family)